MIVKMTKKLLNYILSHTLSDVSIDLPTLQQVVELLWVCWSLVLYIYIVQVFWKFCLK